ncbi:MAG TPA: hypothetical protein VGU71_13075 [Candidatus Dormibacteraeota bacterium]|nr:hypothetical protein [Candidatus Dormibacteraeota bacterium]
MIFDVQRELNPRHLQESFDRAAKLQGGLRKKESRIKRQAQQLAWGLAALMDPGDHHHRVHVGIHAFDVDGQTCLASAYDEEVGDKFRYRYAVLWGGEAAKKALRTAQLDPGDSDEPGPHRRIALATYEDYEEFIERLPRYLNDVIRDLEAKVERMNGLEATNQKVGAEVRASSKRFDRRATQTRK